MGSSPHLWGGSGTGSASTDPKSQTFLWEQRRRDLGRERHSQETSQGRSQQVQAGLGAAPEHPPGAQPRNKFGIGRAAIREFRGRFRGPSGRRLRGPRQQHGILVAVVGAADDDADALCKGNPRIPHPAGSADRTGSRALHQEPTRAWGQPLERG